MEIVQLEPVDMILAAHHAGIICGIKQIQNKSGLPNKRISNNTDYNIHYIGMLGEIAVGKYLNIPVKTEILKGGDGGVDMLYNGKSIQVKTRTFVKPPIYILYTTLEEMVADWHILCTVESPTSVGIHGFISKAKFVQKAELMNFGYNDCYAVDAKMMASMDQFARVAK
jgi:hypothetical protein